MFSVASLVIACISSHRFVVVLKIVAEVSVLAPLGVVIVELASTGVPLVDTVDNVLDVVKIVVPKIFHTWNKFHYPFDQLILATLS